MTPTSSDPWLGLPVPADKVIGRRWPAPHPLQPYWAVGPGGAPGLVTRGIDQDSLPSRLPRPRGLAVTSGRSDDSGPELHLFLETPQDRDVFRRLCEDLLEWSATADSAATATRLLIERLSRWQALLSMARTDDLPDHEVRGLFGELAVLLDFVAPALGIHAAVEAWAAPDCASQDFHLPTGLLEVKTRISGTDLSVDISSLEQLDDCSRRLHLGVVAITPQPGGRTINDQAAELLQRTDEYGLALGELARHKLARRGYAASPRYDDLGHAIDAVTFYRVEGAFPRLTRHGVPEGITRATYAVSVAAIATHATPSREVFEP